MEFISAENRHVAPTLLRTDALFSLGIPTIVAMSFADKLLSLYEELQRAQVDKHAITGHHLYDVRNAANTPPGAVAAVESENIDAIATASADVPFHGDFESIASIHPSDYFSNYAAATELHRKMCILNCAALQSLRSSKSDSYVKGGAEKRRNDDSMKETEDRAKRPRNAFDDPRRRMATENPSFHSAEISKRLDAKRKMPSDEEKRPFIEEAKRLLAISMQDEPCYKDPPRRVQQAIAKESGRHAVSSSTITGITDPMKTPCQLSQYQQRYNSLGGDGNGDDLTRGGHSLSASAAFAAGSAAGYQQQQRMVAAELFAARYGEMAAQMRMSHFSSADADSSAAYLTGKSVYSSPSRHVGVFATISDLPMRSGGWSPQAGIIQQAANAATKHGDRPGQIGLEDMNSIYLPQTPPPEHPSVASQLDLILNHQARLQMQAMQEEFAAMVGPGGPAHSAGAGELSPGKL